MNWNPFRKKPPVERPAFTSPLTLRTKDHPEALGRKPLIGEHAYTFHFWTEFGEKIAIEMGEKAFQSTSQVMLDMLANAPCYDDGTTHPDHMRKMKIVHAIWLNAYIGDKCDTDIIIERAAKMMGIPADNLFDGFDDDYIDRAWCSRPPNWKPQDSLA
jgi:hypothetical protein